MYIVFFSLYHSLMNKVPHRAVALMPVCFFCTSLCVNTRRRRSRAMLVQSQTRDWRVCNEAHMSSRDRNVKVVHYSRTTCPRASIVTNNACISIPSDPRTAPFTSRLNERVKLLVNFDRKYMLIIIIAFSFLNSVASLLISRATTQKSAFYFSDSPF